MTKPGVLSHWLLFGYCNLVIGDYLDLGIWLLEFMWSLAVRNCELHRQLEWRR